MQLPFASTSLAVACTRYYPVPVKPTRIASDFDVRVDEQEPVGGCMPPPPARS
jgi:hypothetical protein